MKKIIFALIIIISYIGVVEAQVFNPITTGNQYGYLQCVSHISSTVTGTTAETTLASCTIPGGSIGANGTLYVRVLASQTNNANSKTLRIKLGATAFAAISIANNSSGHFVSAIANRNSQSSQISFVHTANSFSSSTSSNNIGSIDTSSPQTLSITCQLTSAGDSCVLEALDAWIMRQN